MSARRTITLGAVAAVAAGFDHLGDDLAAHPEIELLPTGRPSSFKLSVSRDALGWLVKRLEKSRAHLGRRDGFVGSVGETRAVRAAADRLRGELQGWPV